MTDLAPAPTDLLCPACGYDLRGLGDGSGARCPECGRPVEREAAAAPSRIPWERRRRIGRVRAYVQTVWLALTRPDVIAREAAVGAVDLASARAFRRVTCLIAFGTIALVVAWAYAASLALSQDLEVVNEQTSTVLLHLRLAADVANAWTGPAPLGWAAEFAVVVAALPGAWLFLAAATGAPACFFYARRLPPARRRSAVAVSYYGSAAFATLPLFIASLCGLLWLESPATARAAPWSIFSAVPGPAAIALIVLTEIGALLVLAASLINLFVMRRVATGCGVRKSIVTAIGLPICWGAMAVFILIGLPLAVAFIGLVILSLRT